MPLNKLSAPFLHVIQKIIDSAAWNLKLSAASGNPHIAPASVSPVVNTSVACDAFAHSLLLAATPLLRFFFFPAIFVLIPVYAFAILTSWSVTRVRTQKGSRESRAELVFGIESLNTRVWDILDGGVLLLRSVCLW